MPNMFNIGGISVSGHNVSITNGQIKVDGIVIEGAGVQNGILEIRIVEGVIENLSADGSVKANQIKGNVSAGGSITCDCVGGSINAGGSVKCGRVGGHINAGGSVRHA